MRYLALDVGNKRVGIAVGSNEARIASPLCVLDRQTPEADAARLRELIREYEVDQLVVGLPRSTNHASSTAPAGQGGPPRQEELTRAYINRLAPALGLPVVFQDEGYSTAAALRYQRARGLSEKRGRATLDADAAAVILQDFLDSLEPPAASESESIP